MFDDLHDPQPPNATANHLANVAERADRRRRRRTGGLMAAATALLVAGGVTALAVRETDASRATTQTTPATVQMSLAPTVLTATTPSTSQTIGATTQTPTIEAPTTPAPTTAPPTTVAAPELVVTRDAHRPAPPELTTLAATIAERARSVTSFAATARSIPDVDDPSQPTATYEVVMLANGSMWATRADGGFASFDPTTGIARTSSVVPGGDTWIYQEIVGWNENSVGEFVVLGHAPALDVLGLSGDIMVTESSVPALGHRAAWRIEQTAQYGGMGTGPSVTDHFVYLVDQATGLTLARDWVQTQTESDGRTQTKHGLDEFTSFEVGASLPPEFPGVFPDGADVSRSGDPSDFTGTLRESDLAAAFGTGLLVPDLPDVPRHLGLSWLNMDESGRPLREDGTATQVDFNLSLGFQRVTVSVSRALTDASTEVVAPAGTVPAEGVVPAGTVPGGALDDLPIYPNGNGGWAVWTQLDGRNIVVTATGAPLVEQAAELLATMRPPAM